MSNLVSFNYLRNRPVDPNVVCPLVSQLVSGHVEMT